MVPIDDYVLAVLMRDLVGHDQQPAAFVVYLHLAGRAVGQQWRPVSASLRDIADETGLSKKCGAIRAADALRRRCASGNAVGACHEHGLRLGTECCDLGACPLGNEAGRSFRIEGM